MPKQKQLIRKKMMPNLITTDICEEQKTVGDVACQRVIVIAEEK